MRSVIIIMYFCPSVSEVLYVVVYEVSVFLILDTLSPIVCLLFIIRGGT